MRTMTAYNHRAVKIARILTENTEEFVLSAKIAADLGVSVKTVSRELPQVEKLLEEFNLSLQRKAGSGLAVNGRCESCGWDDERWLNEFYYAAYGEDDANWDIDLFRCLDDGFLYVPWKYGLIRWGGEENV